MRVKLDSKRRLTVPLSVLETEPGDEFEVRFSAEEEVLTFRRVKRKLSWLEVWRNCPVPMDHIPPRSIEPPKNVEL
jgi:hypothetical protein